MGVSVYYHIWCYHVQSRHTQHHGIHVLNVTGHQFLDSTHIVSITYKRRRPYKPQNGSRAIRGVL
jgi:hypothetical protein